MARLRKVELKKGGAERHLTMSDDAGGGIVVERLVRYDDDAVSSATRSSI